MDIDELNKEMNRTREKDVILRHVIWEEYGKTDYAGRWISLIEMEIDHIIPESFDKEDLENQEYMRLVGIDKNFNLNSILNYAPLHCLNNRNKSNKLLPPFLAATILTEAKNKAPKIIKKINKLKNENRINSHIAILKNEIQTGNFSEEDIYRNIGIGKGFENKKKVTKDRRQIQLLFSKENINLVAFLPMTIIDSTCLYISFRTVQVSNCTIKLKNNELIDLFNGVYTKPELNLRGFIQYINNENYGVVLGNVFFTLQHHEVIEFCEGIDFLYEQYVRWFELRERNYNAKKFCFSLGKGYKLVKVSYDFWRAIVHYTYKHDAYYNNIDPQNIFEPNDYMLKIYTDKHEIYGQGYHAILNAVPEIPFFNEGKNDIWICWQPLFGKDEDSYDIKASWDVGFTYNWLMSDLIPRVAYHIEQLKTSSSQLKPMKKKTGSYEDFIQCVDIGKYILEKGENDEYIIPQDIQGQSLLYEAVRKLQAYFNTPRIFFLEKRDVVNLYMCVKQIIKSTLGLEKGDISYFGGNLGIPDALNMDMLLEKCQQNMDQAVDSTYSNTRIDYALRIIQVSLRDFKVNLNNSEFYLIGENLKALIEMYNRYLMLEKYRA